MLSQHSVRLTQVEEQLFLRARDRVRVHFQHFEELEGFAVLRANLERLVCKVEFELRSVFLHQHDAACKAEQMQAELDKCTQERQLQQTMCDQVIVAARKLPETMNKRTKELQAFHTADVKLKEKQWAIQTDKLLQDREQVLSAQYVRQLELAELENARRLEAMKEQLEAKKQAEIEYVRVQMRLKLTSKLDRVNT